MYTVPSDKQSKCKYCHLSLLSVSKNNIEYHCAANSWKTVTKEQCENCTRYKSKYIEYPVTINGIENKEIDTTGLGHTVGCLCEIRPCDEQYQNKSYLGIYLGELPISITSRLDNNGILTNSALTNPAIFVPALKKIIYGCESWWHEIKDINDFKNISDEDIENQWYVQLLKSIYPKEFSVTCDNEWHEIKDGTGYPSETCDVIIRLDNGAELNERFLSPSCTFTGHVPQNKIVAWKLNKKG